jgi:hypothetical protein
MMRDRKYLHHGVDFAIDDCEWKSSQGNLSQVRRASDFESAWITTGQCNGTQHCQVVPPAKTGTALFVVGDLVLVLQRGIWMEPVAHFSRA